MEEKRMVDKKTMAIAIILSVILSTALSFGVIITFPQVQDVLRGSPGPQGEIGPQGEQGPQGPELQRKTFGVNIGFDYGNGTVNWFNDTRIDIGDGVMQATLQAVNAEYLLLPNEEAVGGIDFYLTSLDGFTKDKGGSWHLWMYIEWYDGSLRGADCGTSFINNIPLPDGKTLKWVWTRAR